MRSGYLNQRFILKYERDVKRLKGMLLRVGIDEGTDGCLAPIFEDHSFEYIPLSETEAHTEGNRTYRDYIGKKGESLATYLTIYKGS